MRATFLLLLAILAVPMTAQQPATRTYTKPDIEYAEAFSQIVGLRELSDGRLVIADSRDKSLQIIDLKGGAPKKIGREGSGPAEWLSLSKLYAMPGDTTLMVDSRNNRLMIIAPDGTPVRTFTPAAPAGAGGNVTVSGGGVLGARWADSRGRLYYQDANFSFNSATPLARPDTMPIVRFDLRTQAADTIAFIRLAPPGKPVTTTVGGATISATQALPFAPADAWSVLPDGRVAIAHATPDYHVEIATSRTARVHGPRVQYTPVPVTAAEKKAYMDNLKATAGQRRMTVNGVTTPAPPPPEPTEWPATLPPFSFRDGVVTSPTGEVWVLRSRPANDQVPTFDVFSADGRLTRKVVLPKSTSIIGFGAKSLYLQRTDDDGLQYVQRYALQ